MGTIEITNPKHQMTNKLQTQIPKSQTPPDGSCLELMVRLIINDELRRIGVNHHRESAFLTA